MIKATSGHTVLINLTQAPAVALQKHLRHVKMYADSKITKLATPVFLEKSCSSITQLKSKKQLSNDPIFRRVEKDNS